MSNSAYADQRKYGGDIANISNSPYTDERRQGGGGSAPGDGTGNVQYDIANQTLNTRLAGVNTIIQDINQGASGFVIGNNVGNLNFDATDATVKLTSSLADVTLQAQEIVRTQGIKGAKMEAGFDLSTGLYENEIDMTLDTAEAKVQIKSEGTSGENTIRLTTTSSAPTQAGSVNLSLFSTASPLVSDRLVMAIEGVVENPPNNSPAWFTVIGQTVSQELRTFELFSNQARFRNFLTMSFAGGTVNPIYEFQPSRFYRFNSDVTQNGQALTVTGGSGEDDDPWLMDWVTPAGGGGGLGNVIYDGSRLNVDNGTGSTVITNINYTNAPLTIQNDGGGLTFNAVTDSTTVRGDNLLELRSSEGIVQIDADTDVNINATNNINIESLLGNVSIASNNDIDINASFGNVTLTMGSQTNPSTGVYNNDSFKNTAGDLFAWRNREPNTGEIVGGFKMSRNNNNAELLICSNIDLFTFAGNNINIPFTPTIRFNQVAGVNCNVQFTNSPTIGNVLTVDSGGVGNAPFLLEWKPPASGGGGNVTSDFLTDRLTRDNGAGTQVPIQNIIQGGSGTNNNLNNPFLLSSGGPISIISDSVNSAQLPGILIDATTNNSNIQEDVTAIFRAEKSTPQGGVVRKAEIECVVDNSDDQRTDYIQLQVTRILQPAPDDIATINLEQTTQIVPPEVLNLNRFRCDNVTDFMFASINVNEPAFSFRSSQYWEFVNDASDGNVLTCSGGTGARNDPKELTWSSGNNLNTLDINYDQATSVLVLSDPDDGVISTTTVVGGRTVLVEDVTVNGTTELSALGLSNSIFPPPLEGQTGYFDGLVGNSPPRVSLNPVTGLTNWFKGASFRATLSGEIVKIGGYDDIILRVYSNRGQASQNILNSFRMVTRSVSPPPKLGWKWVIDFTCRSVNDGGILGVLATSSQFDYTDDTYTLETYGAIVSNTNSSFDTSVEQFLDFTIEFDYYNQSNNIKSTIATIERIF